MMRLGGVEVGGGAPPVVVAEVSANHGGDLDRAGALVDAIAATGAPMVKFQTYTADTLTIPSDAPAFRVREEHGLWGGRRLHDLYAEAHLPWEWHAPLFERSRAAGVVPFSSPFDPSAVELLEHLGCEVYKIASAELVDTPLIREVARTGKPAVLSTGMATLGEVEAALGAFRSAGGADAVLLACTASYPARPDEAHLGNIAVLREAFGVPVGLSDHTPGTGVAVAAVALGAVLVEKHVTGDRGDGGVDSAFSLDTSELAILVAETAAAHAAVSGGVRFGVRPSEEETARLRRSLYVVADVRAGDEVTRENVRSIRPAGGLPPGDVDLVLGRAFRRDATAGTPLTWDLL